MLSGLRENSWSARCSCINVDQVELMFNAFINRGADNVGISTRVMSRVFALCLVLLIFACGHGSNDTSTPSQTGGGTNDTHEPSEAIGSNGGPQLLFSDLSFGPRSGNSDTSVSTGGAIVTVGAVAWAAPKAHRPLPSAAYQRRSTSGVMPPVQQPTCTANMECKASHFWFQTRWRWEINKSRRR